MLTTLKSLCVAAAICAFPAQTWGLENSVIIESKTVPPGADSVRVAIWFNNADPISGVYLPLEIRNESGQAFIRDFVALEFSPAGRAINSGLNGESICWPWPWVNPRGLQVRTFDTSFHCSGPISSSYGHDKEPLNQNFISPEGLLWYAENGSCLDYALAPGVDPAPPESSSCSLFFGVTTSSGQFVIDTCCIAGTHLWYGVEQGAVEPSFVRGVITVNCECPCSCDPKCDSVLDALDLAVLIGRAFGGDGIAADEYCFGQGSAVDGRTDVDCSGGTDIVDVVRMIEVVIRGQAIDELCCDPCTRFGE